MLGCIQPVLLDELPPTAAETVDSGDVYWIDLDTPNEHELKRIYEQFMPIHPLTLSDTIFPQRNPEEHPHFPKVEEFRDYLFVIVNPPLPSPLHGTAQAIGQLSAVLNHTILITHHYGPLVGIAELSGYLMRHEEQAERGPDYLFHLILDSIVDEYAPMLDQMSDELEILEEAIFEQPTPLVLERLIEVKRRVIGSRKTLIMTREVLARLTRGEFKLVDAREMAYYRNVYDHLSRYTELIESAREMVGDLIQLHMAAMSNRLNNVMKFLTMISTIVLPMTLIAGIYGMNLKLKPDDTFAGGFYFALILMAVCGGSSFAFFRYRRWI